MINFNRNLLVFINSGLLDEKTMEKEVECLNEVLLTTESPEQFCKVHELVDRNRITNNRNKILKESCHFNLRPFRFLINKN